MRGGRLRDYELLEKTLTDAFYPELWELRNRLTALAEERGMV